MPSAHQAFVFLSNLPPSVFTHCLLSTLSPITVRSHPATGLSSCGLTSVSILNLFSLPRVVLTAPDHTQGVSFGAETPPGPSRLSVGTAWGKAGCLHASPHRRTLLGAGPPPYLSRQPRGLLPLHQSRLSSARGAVPRRPAPPGSPSAPSSAPASHSFCGSLMMKTTGHMKAAPLMRVRGLQAMWEVVDSTAPAGRQRPSH